MDDLLLFLCMSPPLIAFALLYLACHFAKKHNIKKKQQEREHRHALRCIARDKELDEQLKFEFSEIDKPHIIRCNPKLQEIYDYIKENVEGV